MKEKTAYKVAAISGMIALDLVVFGYVLCFFAGFEPGDSKLMLAVPIMCGVNLLTVYVIYCILDPDKKEERRKSK